MWQSYADSDNRRVGSAGPERALPIYTVNDADWGGGGELAWPDHWGCYSFTGRAGSVGVVA